MSEIAIKVEGLSKRYEIGRRPNANLTEKLKDAGRAMLSFGRQSRAKEFWALRDVSFELGEGEVLGIIGGNGAGKSTLLKILSRITTPTKGTAHFRGRMASLLEVGTGFHPELTGRENIYLNGAILGMSRTEITRNFDAIVDFSGIEDFIDTPVKRYSSGMYVRLAFAVAAHLQAEIMIVDEVLAVGDAEFQKKCLGMIGDVAHSGRTVLFVSHNMAAVRNLCNKAITIDKGLITFSGGVEEAIKQYSQGSKSRQSLELGSIPRSQGGDVFRFTSYQILNEKKVPADSVRSGDTLYISIQYETRDESLSFDVGFAVFNQFQQRCFSVSTYIQKTSMKVSAKNGNLTICLPRLPLNEGTYYASIEANNSTTILDRLENAFPIVVESGDYYGTGRMPNRINPLLVEFSITHNDKTDIRGR